MKSISVFIVGLLALAFGPLQAQNKKTTSKLDASKAKVDSLERKLSNYGLDAELAPKIDIGLPNNKGGVASIANLLGDNMPDLGLKAAEFKTKRAEKQKKKQEAKLAKVEYKGIPMQEQMVRYGSGDRANVEIFHILKEYKAIDPYVRGPQTRWFDLKKKNLSSSVVKDKENTRPLHGSYKKYVAGMLIEEGYYYLGAKDGRWVKYDSKYNLIDKSFWNRGFPADARITYYDSSKTKIKEIIPIQFGVVDGEYLQFYDGGQLMTAGKYERGVRVGRWFDYYQYRGQRKTEVQYPKSSWDADEEEAFIVKEWDDKGKLLYDHSKDARVRAEEEEKEEVVQ